MAKSIKRKIFNGLIIGTAATAVVLSIIPLIKNCSGKKKVLDKNDSTEQKIRMKKIQKRRYSKKDDDQNKKEDKSNKEIDNFYENLENSKRYSSSAKRQIRNNFYSINRDEQNKIIEFINNYNDITKTKEIFYENNLSEEAKKDEPIKYFTRLEFLDQIESTGIEEVTKDFNEKIELKKRCSID